MEQKSRKPLRGQLAYEQAPAIPSPRLPATDAVADAIADDEIDSDAPVQVAPPVKVDDGLSEREHAILAFERQSWRHAGAKEQAIRDQFDLSATRYYQLLNALLDNPAALAHDPVLVGRLRRLRGSRARARGR